MTCDIGVASVSYLDFVTRLDELIQFHGYIPAGILPPSLTYFQFDPAYLHSDLCPKREGISCGLMLRFLLQRDNMTIDLLHNGIVLLGEHLGAHFILRF